MEHTFISIHDLSPEANILFVSASITDILKYEPHEVQGRSCFDYFHPDEEPWARRVHGRGVKLDKAVSLHYLQIRHRNGRWISCECCFTMVHNALVACTSICRRSANSERRAIKAPQIRRIFWSSPEDTLHQMLEHTLPDLSMPPTKREFRAALILNRFTRPLPIMFATETITQILGLRPHHLRNKSFYEYIANSCLAEAVRCLESAKSNESIAYLRFWFRDPRTDKDFEVQDDREMDGFEEGGTGVSNSDLGTDSGVQRSFPMDIYDNADIKAESTDPGPFGAGADYSNNSNHQSSHIQSSTYLSLWPEYAMKRRQPALTVAAPHQAENGIRRPYEKFETFELEAIVSCTSDGVVVILRKARPPVSNIYPTSASTGIQRGFSAALWGKNI